MTASLVGQVGPGQRPASRRRRESSEGRLGPLLNQQPTPTIQPNPPHPPRRSEAGLTGGRQN